MPLLVLPFGMFYLFLLGIGLVGIDRFFTGDVGRDSLKESTVKE